GVRAHAEWKRAGGGAHVGGDRRKFPASRWKCAHPGSSSVLYGHRSHRSTKRVKRAEGLLSHEFRTRLSSVATSCRNSAGHLFHGLHLAYNPRLHSVVV